MTEFIIINTVDRLNTIIYNKNLNDKQTVNFVVDFGI